MAKKKSLMTIPGETVNVTLELSSDFEADLNPFIMISHKEEPDTFILMNGRLQPEWLAEQRKVVQEDPDATLLQTRQVTVDGKIAELFTQRDREGSIHLVLIVPYGEQGRGLLLRGVYPEKNTKLESEIQQMFLSVTLTEVREITDESVAVISENPGGYPLELQQALKHPLEITALDLDAAEFKCFPPEILTMKNLEKLRLGRNDITVIPAGIAELKKLTCLVISENPLTTLPEALGQLPALELLNAEMCELTTVPAALGNLSGLKRLCLNYNRLTTLPAEIAQLKQLDYLGVLDNPFRSLPAVLQALTTTRIEIRQKHKALYTDVTYSAPAPARPIQDQDRYARFEPILVERMHRVFSEPDWAAHREALEYCALRGVGLRSRDQEQSKHLGQSRLGGLPDLPAELDYPTKEGKLCTFLAQIALRDLSAHLHFLPREGRLYFFIDDQDAFTPTVLYSSAPEASLRLFKPQAGMTYYDQDQQGYPGFTVEWAAYPALPIQYHRDLFILDHPKVKTLKTYLADDHNGDAYYLKVEQLKPFPGLRADKDWHSINSYIFTQNASPQELAAEAKGGRPEEWIVLLALGYDSKTGFEFWDAGTLYFMIHQTDLANLNFSNVFCGLESS